jgi:Na+-transporting methylmalonyl-CoA/oxaloacetate decarboxylase gamma subunit
MDNLQWGLQITALGMGLVFALLALLWGLLTLVLRFDRAPGVERAGVAAAAVTDSGLDPALVAAITLAVLQHSAVRRGEAAPAMCIHWPGTLLHASRWVAAGRARQTRSWRRGR